MIVSYRNRSDRTGSTDVGAIKAIELTVQSFKVPAPTHNAPIRFSRDRKSYRATYVSTRYLSVVNFCKITEATLPDVEDMIRSIAYREPITLDNQGHTGHPAVYQNVICTSDTLQIIREGRLYTLSMPIEILGI